VKQFNFYRFASSVMLAILVLAFGISMKAGANEDLANKNPLDLEFTYTGEKIDFCMDLYHFLSIKEGKYDKTEYSIELWYKIPNPQIKFVQPTDKASKNKLEAHLVVAMNLFSEGEKIEEKSQVWARTFGIDEEKDAQNPDKFIMGTFDFLLKPGTYVAKLGISDIESNKLGIKKTKFIIPALDESKIMLSSIKFANWIEDPLKKEPESDIYFVKNINKRIFPNIERKFKAGSDMNFYYEIYNLKTNEDDKPNFDITYYFHRIEKDGDSTKIIKLMKRTVKSDPNAQGNVSPQIYTFNLLKEYKSKKTGKMRSVFIPGNYEMIVEIIDHNRKIDENRKGIKFNFTIEE